MSLLVSSNPVKQRKEIGMKSKLEASPAACSPVFAAGVPAAERAIGRRLRPCGLGGPRRPRGRRAYHSVGHRRLRRPGQRRRGQRPVGARRAGQVDRHGRPVPGSAGPLPRRAVEAVRRTDRRAARTAVRGLRCLPQGDRLPAPRRRGPADHARRLSCGPPGIRRRERRERVHGEVVRRRSGRHPADPAGRRGGGEEGPESRRGPDVPAFHGAASDDPADPRRGAWATCT